MIGKKFKKQGKGKGLEPGGSLGSYRVREPPTLSGSMTDIGYKLNFQDGSRISKGTFQN